MHFIAVIAEASDQHYAKALLIGRYMPDRSTWGRYRYWKCSNSANFSRYPHRNLAVMKGLYYRKLFFVELVSLILSQIKLIIATSILDVLSRMLLRLGWNFKQDFTRKQCEWCYLCDGIDYLLARIYVRLNRKKDVKLESTLLNTIDLQTLLYDPLRTF